jgi:hypothetical protein
MNEPPTFCPSDHDVIYGKTVGCTLTCTTIQMAIRPFVRIGRVPTDTTETTGLPVSITTLERLSPCHQPLNPVPLFGHSYGPSLPGICINERISKPVSNRPRSVLINAREQQTDAQTKNRQNSQGTLRHLLDLPQPAFPD